MEKIISNGRKEQHEPKQKTTQIRGNQRNKNGTSQRKKNRMARASHAKETQRIQRQEMREELLLLPGRKESVTYELKFEIKGLPHSTNSIGRKHWGAKANEARRWRRIVHETILFEGHQRPKTPLKRAELTLTRFSSVCGDADGIASSFKHVIDGLVDAGIIENDRIKNIGFPKYDWQFAKKGQGKISIHVKGEEQ